MFTNKVVIITGAGSGIGAATAKQFAKMGALLSLADINSERLSKIQSECETINKKKPLTITGDIGKPAVTKDLLESTVKQYKKVDVLVNNAGILEFGGIENTSLEQFDRIFNTNVKSMYHLTMLAVPHLLKTKGSIVNLSSINGVRSFPGLLAYNMSKTTVDQFTKTIALELAARQVRVNSVAPGIIITDLHRRGGVNQEEYEKFLQRCKETHPLGRPGKPEEVADAIIFLAGDHASFITGVNLSVDGGRHALCPR